MEKLILNKTKIIIFAILLFIIGIVIISTSLIMVNGDISKYKTEKTHWYQTIKITDNNKIDIGLSIGNNKVISIND